MCNFYCYAGVSLFCCGQLSLLVWSDSESTTSRELLDNHLVVPANGGSLINLPIHTTYKSTSAKASTQVVSSNISTMTVRVTDSTSTKITSTAAAATTGPVMRVKEIKELYDSDLILSHGVKLKWIRNRMMA